MRNKILSSVLVIMLLNVAAWAGSAAELMQAVRQDDAKTVEQLLNGSDNSLKKHQVKEAFVLAVQKGNKDVVEAFVSSPYEIDSHVSLLNMTDVLSVAANDCNADVVDLLVEKFRSTYDKPDTKWVRNAQYEQAIFVANEQIKDLDVLLEIGELVKTESFGHGVVDRLVAKIETPEDEKFWQNKQQECRRIVKTLKELKEAKASVNKAVTQIGKGLKKDK